VKTVSIPVNDEILFVLKKDIDNLQIDFKQSLAMQYFRNKQLGLGMASQMAGMPKDEFVVLLGRHNIDIYQYTDDELIDEFELTDRIAEGIN